HDHAIFVVSQRCGARPDRAFTFVDVAAFTQRLDACAYHPRIVQRLLTLPMIVERSELFRDDALFGDDLVASEGCKDRNPRFLVRRAPALAVALTQAECDLAHVVGGVPLFGKGKFRLPELAVARIE